MKLQKYNGGISTRKASHLIGVNEGTVCTNVDIENELLGPVKEPLAAGLTLTDKARYVDYADDIITLAKTPHTTVEYKDRLYYSVLGDYVQVKDDVSEGDLGFVAPVILDSTIITPTVATPLLANVTVTEVDESTSGFDESWHYKAGTDYYFAIVERSQWTLVPPAPSEKSAPLYFTHSTTLDTCSLTIDYTGGSGLFDLYKKVAGKWRKLSSKGIEIPLLDGFWILGNNILDIDLTIYDSTGSADYEILNLWWGSHINSVSTRFHTGLYNTQVPYFWGPVVDVTELNATTLSAGDYTYVAIQTSSTLGWQSPRSEFLEATILSGELLAFTVAVADVDSRADQLSIYRIGNTITEFTLVDRIDNPTYPLIYTDVKADTEISGSHILTTEASGRTKLHTGVTNLAIAGGQLVGTYKTRLVFSEIGQVYAFPLTNYREFRETLTGCFVIDSGLLVFSARKTWLLNTSNVATGKVIQLSDEFGCSGHETIVGLKTGAMWASKQGFCTSSGGRVELVSKDKIGYRDLSITKAVMHNEVYYGFTNEGICYALDMRYGVSFIDYIFSIFNDLNAATVIRQVYVDGAELKVLFGSAIATDSYTLFAGADNEIFSWYSAKFIEGSLTELKHYKDIYIYSTKDITVDILIDDIIVLSRDLVGATTMHELQVPQSKQQGYGIQFQVTGTGELSEIEYKTMGRQNGR